MLLAFDDSDGPDGGCTTHALFRVLLALPHLAPVGLPRLVRLNPNVPWKTRGNGAVAVRLGAPTGPQVRIGELRGREILAFPDARPAVPTKADLDAAWAALRDTAQPDAEPGMVLVDEAPASVYAQAVTTEVGRDEAEALLSGQLHRGGRGLIGALAAAAWPGPPTSYEFLAYREPRRCGTPRAVQAAPLALLDATGATFATWDPQTRRPVCVPHGPDPVLIGLRGHDPDVLRDAALRALPAACDEPIDGWLLWATNHGSGDHVVEVPFLAAAPPMATVAAKATVSGPATRRGGHVFVPCTDAAGDPCTAIAFAPSGRFRDTVARLVAGDRIVCVGALEHAAGEVDAKAVVKLERLRIDHAPRRRKTNPRCACGKSMKSRGRDAGYRCARCGTDAPAGTETWTAVPGPSGWHDVRIGARRHLHPTSPRTVLPSASS